MKVLVISWKSKQIFMIAVCIVAELDLNKNYCYN